MNDYNYLCCECGVITPADQWTFWRWNDEGTALVETQDGDAANLCPHCGHYHRDDDSGAGIMDGTREELDAERAKLVEDEVFADMWADVAERLTTAHGDSQGPSA